ncbi:hypothetical protein [Exiguobacterium sp. RIT341]|uniref:hypothetical protein n=1 Tax=Exiguobacterium sp. RIT341 TaxID=1470592 RepID=UPI000448CE81|nr:hypothetical protein [Exiguobacterium sp. RIT341]EZP61060.1 hypothetical protein BW42_00731 [Exiguobacterium sp. RIT341]
MKKKWIAILVIGLIVIIGGWYVSFKESQVSGFPVPRFATAIEKQGEWKIKTRLVSETDGPGLLYRTRIRQAGWEEFDREGATAWYEKEGKVVALTTFDGELYLENSSKEDIRL